MLLSLTTSYGKLRAALPGNRKQFLEARMQIEHINVRSHCVSGPAELWEPVDWWSGGQQVLARQFISQGVF